MLASSAMALAAPTVGCVTAPPNRRGGRRGKEQPSKRGAGNAARELAPT
jgi:hypothetical protein